MIERIIDWSLVVALCFALGWLSGRILGVHRSAWRSLVCGLAGWGIGFGATYALHETDITTPAAPTVIGFAVLATMGTSIALDLVLTPRPRRSRRPALHSLVHPVQAIKRRFAVSLRLREIMRYARNRKLTSFRSASTSMLESADFAQRLRLFLEDCGGMFVKIGQIASTRSDVLAPAMIAELSQLRASVRPVPPDEIRVVIESELDQTVEQAFASFDWDPLAAASIGQVHRAVLRDGTHVVVKVQRPGIEDIVERDAAVLRWIARNVERRVEAAREARFAPITEELITGLEEELDYAHEAAAAVVLGRHRSPGEGVAVPFVRADLSTSRVLVMQEVPGESIDHDAAIDASSVPRPELARRLLAVFLHQVITDGAFHADPHPGNIMLDEDGTLWLIDFGAVGYLDPLMLNSLQMLVLGVAMFEPSLLTRAVLRIAGTNTTVDRDSLETDLSLLLAQQARAGGFDPRSLGDVVTVMLRHHLAPPPAFTTLSRALITLEGTLRVLDPDFEVGHEAMTAFAEGRATPAAETKDQVQKELIRALPTLRTLPGHAETLSSMLEAGELTMQTRRFGADDAVVIGDWIDRILFTSIGIAGLVTSAILMLAAGSSDEGTARVIRAVGYAGLVVSGTMLMRSIAQILTRRAR